MLESFIISIDFLVISIHPVHFCLTQPKYNISLPFFSSSRMKLATQYQLKF